MLYQFACIYVWLKTAIVKYYSQNKMTHTNALTYLIVIINTHLPFSVSVLSGKQALLHGSHNEVSLGKLLSAPDESFYF